MGDLDKPTQDVAIYDEAGNAVTVGDKTTTAVGLNTLAGGVSTGVWQPADGTQHADGDTHPLSTDIIGQLRARSLVLTDELSFADPFAGVALGADWTSGHGAGGTVTVADSKVTLACGTGINEEVYINREIDYGPLWVRVDMSISQRIANQEICIYMRSTDQNELIEIEFSGTDNTKIICNSRSFNAVSGQEQTIVTLPNSWTTAMDLIYWMYLTSDQISFNVGTTTQNRVCVASHSRQIPGPYTPMDMRIRCLNGAIAPASNTNIIVDNARAQNINRVDVQNAYAQDAIQSQIVGYDSVSGFNKRVQVDSSGRIITTSPAGQGISNSLRYDNTSIAALVGNAFRRVLTYTIPTGYTINLVQFQSACGSLAGTSRIVKVIGFGTFNTSTNVFTNGDAYGSREFASILIARVTTVLSATPTTLTATYINQDGVAGRTATAVIPSASAVDVQVEFALQAGDYGVQDVTNITDSAAPTGVISIEGVDELGFHRHTTADLIFETVEGSDAVIVSSGIGGILALEFTSTGTAAASRKLKALITLYPSSV